ncbi:MAG: hypothetical protein U0840_01555 [Gemmataceae bacterium]
MRLLLVLVVWGASGVGAWADEPPVPVTRPEMKKVLEALKKAKPRLPLPPLSEADGKAGGLRIVNNGRMRQLYLPEELRSADFPRGQDAALTLDPTFKVELFWIVSRTNNCRYCLGHQEWKLATAGRTEDQIAALDGDWSEFTPAQRAAFALTRQLTFQPHTLKDASLDEVRKHYKPLQILEILFTVANNNATNRWTDSLGIPQEQTGRFFRRAQPAETEKAPAVLASFLIPTSPRYQAGRSKVAPLEEAGRPKLESRSEVEAALAACRKRTPRLPLVEEKDVRTVLGTDAPEGVAPQWVRLLANFPVAGKSRYLSLRAAAEKGTLDRKLRAQIAWIAAREDRAWYALGQARQRLLALGVSEKEIWALDGDGDGFSPAERAAFGLARKLTATPHRMTDDDIAGLRKHYSDSQVAELVYQVCNAAFFNRLTEAAGLRLEE